MPKSVYKRRSPLHVLIPGLALSILGTAVVPTMLVVGISPVHANIGSGEGLGVGNTKTNIKKLTRNDFLSRSKGEHKELRTLNDREDSEVRIDGFPSYVTRYLLDAIINDSRRIKGLFKALSGVTDDVKRQKIIKRALTKARAKEDLLKKDVQTTERQKRLEANKIEKARKGILRKPFVKTKRLITLEKTLEEQRLRHRKAQTVTEFLRSWLNRPHMGK